METKLGDENMTEPVDTTSEQPAALSEDERAEAILEAAMPIKAGTYYVKAEKKGVEGKTESYRLTTREARILELRHVVLKKLGDETLSALAGVPELQVASAKVILDGKLMNWPTVEFERGGKPWKLVRQPEVGAGGGGFRIDIGDDRYSFRPGFRSDLGGNTISTKVNGDEQTNSPEAYRQFKELIASVKPLDAPATA